MNTAVQIGILGAGAVGHMLAYLLQEFTSYDVQILGREGPRPLKSQIVWGERALDLDIPLRSGACQLLLVALKSYDIKAALREQLPHLAPGTPLVILSNGYIEPEIAELREPFAHLIWRKGIVTKGIKVDAEGRYRMGMQGEVIWGSREDPTAVESGCMRELAAFGWHWSADTCPLRKAKWYYNTVLNTLCAAYRLPRNGDALRLFEADGQALAHEVFTLGCELWPDWKAAEDELWWELRRLIQKTADNENSMARDVRLGRRTEADALSGCLRLSADPARYPLLISFHERVTGKSWAL